MKRATVTAGVALALVACVAPVEPSPPSSKPCDRPYTALPHFTATQRPVLDASAKRWNAVAVWQSCVIDEPGHPTIGIMVEGGPEYEAFRAQLGYDVVWGVCFDDQLGGGIRISSAVPPEYFAPVVMHELGHCSLGLGHIAGSGIMGPDLAQDISSGDMNECRRVGSCASSGAGRDASGYGQRHAIVCGY